MRGPARGAETGGDVDYVTCLRVLVATADGGSLSRAAGVLHMTVSSVSRAITVLEQDLGAAVFNRSTRGLHLTEIGGRFLARARDILAELDDARAEAASLNAAPRGRLRVLASPSVGRAVIAPLLPGFLKAYPDIDLDLRSGPAGGDLSHILIESGADIAVVTGRPPDSGLLFRPVLTGSWWLMAPPGRVPADAGPDDLSGLPCLAPSGQEAEWRCHRGGRTVVLPTTGRITADSPDMLRALAAAGAGLALLPDWMFLHAAPGEAGLERVLADWRITPAADESCDLSALYPRKKVVPPKTRAFVTALGAAGRAFDARMICLK
ncbi:putative LysR-family transcriptional regulator [Gluconacetobacter diazotrophicus PA1 5]|uniref:Putative LysR-family transcriptional regulator n=1 Tax=Gluconacetobacter diazotrophicus (strain ATCC 49037 / DSM 5601 / CCUG 37298 / CIP 103539 / LMG 7603 / PAl5) TaxID=272568 RepID=A9HF43_GLUDA|nr:putative LysR-family transcriptional regulator [Gluconacetobacter diazotrophicus PA1 5]